MSQVYLIISDPKEMPGTTKQKVNKAEFEPNTPGFC